MKVPVKLYGNLRREFPDYDHEKGMQVEIPEGAAVKDLLALLDLFDPARVVVVVEGRILQPEDELRPGFQVNVFQVIQGG